MCTADDGWSWGGKMVQLKYKRLLMATNRPRCQQVPSVSLTKAFIQEKIEIFIQKWAGFDCAFSATSLRVWSFGLGSRW
jgi:hypothetical protein